MTTRNNVIVTPGITRISPRSLRWLRPHPKTPPVPTSSASSRSLIIIQRLFSVISTIWCRRHCRNFTYFYPSGSCIHFIISSQPNSWLFARVLVLSNHLSPYRIPRQLIIHRHLVHTVPTSRSCSTSRVQWERLFTRPHLPVIVILDRCRSLRRIFRAARKELYEFEGPTFHFPQSRLVCCSIHVDLSTTWTREWKIMPCGPQVFSQLPVGLGEHHLDLVKLHLDELYLPL